MPAENAGNASVGVRTGGGHLVSFPSPTDQQTEVAAKTGTDDGAAGRIGGDGCWTNVGCGQYIAMPDRAGGSGEGEAWPGLETLPEPLYHPALTMVYANRCRTMQDGALGLFIIHCHITIYGRIPKWIKGTDCKSVIRGFESRSGLFPLIRDFPRIS